MFNLSKGWSRRWKGIRCSESLRNNGTEEWLHPCLLWATPFVSNHLSVTEFGKVHPEHSFGIAAPTQQIILIRELGSLERMLRTDILKFNVRSRQTKWHPLSNQCQPTTAPALTATYDQALRCQSSPPQSGNLQGTITFLNRKQSTYRITCLNFTFRFTIVLA